MDSDGLELVAGDGELGVIPSVDVGAFEELEEAVVFRGGAGEDVAQSGVEVAG